jgi:hypothetical protein
MKLPRDLAGEQLVKLLCKRFGYVRVNQEGIRDNMAPRGPDVLQRQRFANLPARAGQGILRT